MGVCWKIMVLDKVWLGVCPPLSQHRVREEKRESHEGDFQHSAA